MNHNIIFPAFFAYERNEIYFIEDERYCTYSTKTIKKIDENVENISKLKAYIEK